MTVLCHTVLYCVLMNTDACSSTNDQSAPSDKIMPTMGKISDRKRSHSAFLQRRPHTVKLAERALMPAEFAQGDDFQKTSTWWY